MAGGLKRGNPFRRTDDGPRGTDAVDQSHRVQPKTMCASFMMFYAIKPQHLGQTCLGANGRSVRWMSTCDLHEPVLPKLVGLKVCLLVLNLWCRKRGKLFKQHTSLHARRCTIKNQLDLQAIVAGVQSSRSPKCQRCISTPPTHFTVRFFTGDSAHAIALPVACRPTCLTSGPDVKT